MISKEILKEVYTRDSRKCVVCGAKKVLEGMPHHCFYKSEYFKEDKNEAWNLVTICMISIIGNIEKEGCHRRCHGGDKIIQRICKLIALKSYKGEYKNELLKIMKGKGFDK